jgi:hypothetical protein
MYSPNNLEGVSYEFGEREMQGFNLIIPCSLLEGYGLIIIERVIASKAKQSFTVRLPRR